MPETRVVADGVEGICVNLNGECHHERVQVENSRSQGEEGEEIKSPKRKFIRVESEGGSGGTEFRTECDQCSAKADVSL